MRIKKDYLDYLGLILFLFLALFFVLSAFSNNLPLRVVVIDNRDPNSMHPSYAQGDIFVIQRLDPSDYKVGDVVVYERMDNGDLIIHRIIFVKNISGEYFFLIKGDNMATNNQPDPDGWGIQNSSFIHEDQIQGKTVVKIPFLGHLSLAMQRNQPFQLLVFVIAGALGLGILFSKEEEKPEEEQYYNVTKTELKAQVTKVVSFFSSPKGILVGVLGGFIVVMLLLQLTVPGIFYSNNEDLTPGVNGVVIRDQLIKDGLIVGSVNLEVLFYEVEVMVFDPGFVNQRLDRFSVVATDSSGNVVSSTHWSMIGHFVGKGVVGGSIAIDFADIAPVDQTFDVVVTAFLSNGESNSIETTVDYVHTGVLP